MDVAHLINSMDMMNTDTFHLPTLGVGTRPMWKYCDLRGD